MRPSRHPSRTPPPHVTPHPAPITLPPHHVTSPITTELAQHGRYGALQEELRRRHPSLHLIIATITNAYRCSYLPDRDAHGRPVYPVDTAVLAPGSLETLIDAVSARLGAV